ncbi:hypothetical protein DMENIID0001_156010 [Sergentomyia squamirostris]
MTQKYSDAISMMVALGKPDLFITFSCNSQWPEIMENLKPHWNRADQIILQCKVFHVKLRDFIDQLVNHMIFGRIKYYTYSIEFQKRGLPHAHFLIGLHNQDKLFTTQQVDHCISAEIPPEIPGDPHQYEYSRMVKQQTIHGPCGPDFSNAPCMKDGHRSKNYPKPLQPATAFKRNGYPVYRRSLNDEFVEKDGVRLNNQWVVFTIAIFLCHINVEYCTMIAVAKYLFKYIFKGVCQANVQLRLGDEIQNYEACRFLTAPEAGWHLLEYETHGNSHSILRLSVHLEGRQNVYVPAGGRLQRSNAGATTLTEWFTSNEEQKRLADAELVGRSSRRKRLQVYKKYGLDLTYPQYCQRFRWNKNTKKWTARERGAPHQFTQIGRMYTISFRDPELVTLRLLLLHVPGCTSFDNVKTVENEVKATFVEAAIARGLITTDEEFPNTIREALGQNVDLRECRTIFAYILQWNQPANALSVWNDLKDRLCQDIVDLLHCTTDEAAIIGLFHIQSILRSNGGEALARYDRDLAQIPGDFIVPDDIAPHLEGDDDHVDQILFDELLAQRLLQLNPQQRSAFDAIVQDL